MELPNFGELLYSTVTGWRNIQMEARRQLALLVCQWEVHRLYPFVGKMIRAI